MRKTLKEMELKQGDNWGGRATEWVPDLPRQANLRDRVVNRMLQDEIVYSVPRENIISVDRKPFTVQKAAAIRDTGIEEKGEASTHEYQGKDLDEKFDRLINALERNTPQQMPPPPQRACHSRQLPPGAGRDRVLVKCSNCGGKHPDEDKAVHEHCPRYQRGKWAAKEFFKVTPQRVFRGADRSKTAEEYWRFILKVL